jgi:hypothetical protein
MHNLNKDHRLLPGYVIKVPFHPIFISLCATDHLLFQWRNSLPSPIQTSPIYKLEHRVQVSVLHRL